MKEPVFDRNGDQVVKTGHTTFDRQTSCISSCVTAGAVNAPTMRSTRVRSWNDLGENDPYFKNRGLVKPGHFFEFDVSSFDLPAYVKSLALIAAGRRPIVLYVFFNHTLKGKVVHGYIITDAEGKLIHKIVTGPSYKSEMVINECAKYVEA
jgi:hypothetical protein